MEVAVVVCCSPIFVTTAAKSDGVVSVFVFTTTVPLATSTGRAFLTRYDFTPLLYNKGECCLLPGALSRDFRETVITYEVLYYYFPSI